MPKPTVKGPMRLSGGDFGFLVTTWYSGVMGSEAWYSWTPTSSTPHYLPGSTTPSPWTAIEPDLWADFPIEVQDAIHEILGLPPPPGLGYPLDQVESMVADYLAEGGDTGAPTPTGSHYHAGENKIPDGAKDFDPSDLLGEFIVFLNSTWLPAIGDSELNKLVLKNFIAWARAGVASRLATKDQDIARLQALITSQNLPLNALTVWREQTNEFILDKWRAALWDVTGAREGSAALTADGEKLPKFADLECGFPLEYPEAGFACCKKSCKGDFIWHTNEGGSEQEDNWLKTEDGKNRSQRFQAQAYATFLRLFHERRSSELPGPFFGSPPWLNPNFWKQENLIINPAAPGEPERILHLNVFTLADGKKPSEAIDSIFFDDGGAVDMEFVGRPGRNAEGSGFDPGDVAFVKHASGRTYWIPYHLVKDQAEKDGRKIEFGDKITVPTRSTLDCGTASVVGMYNIAKDVLGIDFDKRFAGGDQLKITRSYKAQADVVPHDLFEVRDLKVKADKDKFDLGDALWLENMQDPKNRFQDYGYWHPGGYWGRESVVYVAKERGRQLFMGFYLPDALDEKSWKETLANYFNDSVPEAFQVSAKDLPDSRWSLHMNLCELFKPSGGSTPK